MKLLSSSWRHLIAASLALCTLPALAGDVAQRWRDDLLLPRLDALKQASVQLSTAAGELCNRTNQERLDATRKAWTATYVAWRAVDTLPLDANLRLNIDPGHAELQDVEGAVRLATADKPIADTPNSKAMGLHALEYLLWGNDRASVQLGRLAFRQRCAYVHALADALPPQIDALRNATLGGSSPQLANYLDTVGRNIRLWRTTRLAHMGEGKVGTKPSSLSDFDAWRSKETKAALTAELATDEALLLGPENGAPYLADQFDGEQGAARQAQLHDAFATAKAALARIPDDLPDALARDPALAAPLLAALRQIQTVLDQIQPAPIHSLQRSVDASAPDMPATGS